MLKVIVTPPMCEGELKRCFPTINRKIIFRKYVHTINKNRLNALA